MSVGRDAGVCQTFHAEFAPLRIHRFPPSVQPIVSTPSTIRPSLWQRRVVTPLRAQLTQGVTPDKLEATVRAFEAI